MPNVAALLKSEMSRIARKELRAEIEPVRKANRELRGNIAALKKELEALRKHVTRSGRMGTNLKESSAQKGAPPKLRFRAGGLASQRRKLGISAAGMGQLIGVSGQTIYAWEQGKARPRESQLTAVAAVRKLGKREVLRRLEER
jgi:DNA-binding XRE family transcriptional regulator